MKSIKTILELQKYVSINISSSIDKLTPHLNRAERKHLVPLLGKTLFDAQCEEYDTAENNVDSISNEIKQELHRLIQDAVANIGYLNFLAQAQLQFGDAGIRIASNEQMKTAFQWQIEDLKFQLGKDGFDVMEEILVLLEENVATTEVESESEEPESTEEEDLLFPGWATSHAYYRQKEYFVNTAADFDRYYRINGSRMTYLTMRYIMRRIEEFTVKPMLGKDLYLELKTAIKANDFSEVQTTLINDYLAPGVTLLTVAKAIIERAVDISDFGVSVNLYGYYGNMNQKNPAPMADKLPMIAQLEKDGNEFLQGAIAFILDNEDDFESYEAPEENTSRFNLENSEDSGFFKV